MYVYICLWAKNKELWPVVILIKCNLHLSSHHHYLKFDFAKISIDSIIPTLLATIKSMVFSVFFYFLSIGFIVSLYWNLEYCTHFFPVSWDLESIVTLIVILDCKSSSSFVFIFIFIFYFFQTFPFYLWFFYSFPFYFIKFFFDY